MDWKLSSVLFDFFVLFANSLQNCRSRSKKKKIDVGKVHVIKNLNKKRLMFKVFAVIDNPYAKLLFVPNVFSLLEYYVFDGYTIFSAI